MRRGSTVLLLSLLFPPPLATVSAQGTDSDGPVRCVRLNRLDRTEVIDNRRIAFFLRNGDIYLNRLDHECQNLDRGRPFSYRTSNRQLCDVDTITIIENLGFGFSPGATCSLGTFLPVNEADLAILKGEEVPAEVTVTDIEIAQETEEQTPADTDEDSN